MRITFLQHGFFTTPFGGARSIYEHAGWLARRRHRVTVLHPLAAPVRPWTPDLKELVKGQASLAFRALGALGRGAALRLHPGWFPLDPSVTSLLVPGLSPGSLPPADVLIATSWHVARVAFRAPPRCGAKVYYVHEHEGGRAPMKLVDPTYDLPLAYVSNNEAVSEMLRARGRKVIAKIPIGVDPRVHRVRVPPDQRDPRCVGMMYSASPTKGAEAGFEALRLLRAAVPALKALVFGAFPRPSSLPAGCEYAERPSDEELSGLYNRMSVFFSPSWIEGWCLPAHEAMASGCAVVATDTWGIHEFARDGENALIVPPRRPDLLASAVRRLLEDPVLRLRLAVRGRETASALTWDRATEPLESALESLIRERAALPCSPQPHVT